LTYTYDANGLRLQKAVTGGTTTVYIFSGSKVIAEYDNGAAVGSPSREYIYSGGALLAKIESGATVYYHQDGLSARIMTDSSGNKLTPGDQGHYPFGDFWYPGSPITKWMFTTYEGDSESGGSDGNDYAMARYYRDALGRFNSPDLLGGSTADPQSLNRYSYTENDPIDGTDPSGACYAAGWGWVFAAHDVKTLCAPTIEREFLGEVAFEDMDAIIGENEDGWLYNLAVLGEFDVYGPPVYTGPNAPGIHFTQKTYQDCAKQAFGSTSGTIPGTNKSIPSYEAALDVYQASTLVGIDPSVVAGTLAAESNSNLAIPNSPRNPNGSVDIGPMQLSSPGKTSAGFQQFISGNPFGTNLDPNQSFNGNVFDNILTGAAYLQSFGPNNYDQYVSPSGDQARQNLLDQLDPSFTKFFDCLHAHSN